MSFINQTTIVNQVSCYGIGVHSGKNTQLTLLPAKTDTGIVFVRTDMREDIGFVEASYANVSNTSMSTTISNPYGAEISTIEHLLAAIHGCGIDNLIVQIDGPEVPIMDGSSKPFVFMIECAGIKLLNAKRKSLKILKEVRAINNDCEIICAPSNALQIDLTIEFTNKVIGRQTLAYGSEDSFKDSIADARTFGFVQELNYLKSKGLGQGASLDNCIGIEDEIILNHDGLRYSDEFVRHKLLDLVGDLRTASAPIIGNFNCYKTGHMLNNEFLKKLFSDHTTYEWVPTSQ